jgi:hypothetical protein
MNIIYLVKIEFENLQIFAKINWHEFYKCNIKNLFSPIY